MKIDLGNYKYCEQSELEELGKIENKTVRMFGRGLVLKVNGTLFKTELGHYVFYGRAFDIESHIDYANGWKLLTDAEGRDYLSACDSINDTNKWDLLKYEKV